MRKMLRKKQAQQDKQRTILASRRCLPADRLKDYGSCRMQMVVNQGSSPTTLETSGVLLK